jgi:hypothetical protein
MSNPPISSNPRFLLFPQVARSEPHGKQPIVRRYSLTRLPGDAGARRPQVTRPASRGLSAV